ncbi:MAG: hypothetical protein H7836_04765 [Magnetococcus sp. YQC-3]
MFLGTEEVDAYGKVKNPQREAHSYFIETLIYYGRLFESMPDINSILDLEYSLYYDLIIKQVQLKKEEDRQRQQQQKSVQNKKRR